MDGWEHPGYLSRADKIAFGISVTVLVPLAVIGWPFLATGLLILGPLWFALHVFQSRRRRDGAHRGGSHVNFSKFRSKPERIRHFSTRFPNDPPRE